MVMKLFRTVYREYSRFFYPESVEAIEVFLFHGITLFTYRKDKLFMVAEYSTGFKVVESKKSFRDAIRVAKDRIIEEEKSGNDVVLASSKCYYRLMDCGMAVLPVVALL